MTFLLIGAGGEFIDANALASQAVVIESNDVAKLSSIDDDQGLERSNICWPWQNCYVSVYTKDSYEDNNSFSKAYNLGKYSPTRTTYTYGTLHDVTATEKDVDYYKFEIVAKKQVQIDLTHIPTGTDYDIKLYTYNPGFLGIGAYSTYIAGSTKGGNASESIIVELEPGIYYIHIYSYSGLSSSQYRLMTRVYDINNYYLVSGGIATWEYNEVYSYVPGWDNPDGTVDAYRIDKVIYISNSALVLFEQVLAYYGSSYINNSLSGMLGNTLYTGLLLLVVAIPYPYSIPVGILLAIENFISVNVSNDLKTEMNNVKIQALSSNRGMKIVLSTHVTGNVNTKIGVKYAVEPSVWNSTYVYNRYMDEQYGNVTLLTQSEILNLLNP